MSPLWARALRRSWAGGASGPLLAVVLTLLALAAAAAPLFTEAAANAALARTIDAVPATARAADSPVIRLNGGTGPTEISQQAFLEQLDAVRGTGAPRVLAFSVGQELVPRSVRRPVLVSGDLSARARLAGVDDPAAVLDVVAADPDPAGVWLPEPVADAVQVAPGDDVQVAVETLDGRGDPVGTRVAGIYRVGADGRRPADPAGSDLWASRRGGLPTDTDSDQRGAYLAVTDPVTAGDLATRSGDELFWTAEVRLDPTHPTLAAAHETVEDLDELRRDAVDPSLVDVDDGPLRLGVASGLAQIVGEADELAAATEQGTRAVGQAGVAVGLAAVLVAAVLTLRLRTGELHALAALGIPARRTAALAAVELLPPALLALPLGTAAGWAVVTVWGPQGATTSAGLTGAAVAAVTALALALGLVVLATALAAALAARPQRAGAPARRLPWRLALVVLAVVTVAGVAGRPERGLGLGPLDLLVPLLVSAAAGALGSALLVLLARRAARRSALSPGTSGRLRARRAALALAVRRAGATGDERGVVLTVVTAGLAVLTWAMVSVGSVAATVEDRVAVATGASAVAELRGSWELDRDAPEQVPFEQALEILVPADMPVQARTPQLPPGQTVVWRAQTDVPGRDGGVDVLLVDPDSFGAAAGWGSSGALDPLRARLPAMAAGGRESADALRAGKPAPPLPVVVVGDVGLPPGRDASIGTDFMTIDVTVLDVVEVAPGRRSNRPMIVAPADAFLLSHTNLDPRLRPQRTARIARVDQFKAELWVAGGSTVLDQVLEANAIEPRQVRTEDRARSEPSAVAATISGAYQVAVGVVLALMAAGALAFHADRTAAEHRAADVLLARTGIGARGTRRARTAEVVVIGAVATVLAAGTVAVLAPLADRLLDPGDGGLPDLRLLVDPLDAVVLLGGAAVATAVAALAATARGRRPSDAEVVRDA